MLPCIRVDHVSKCYRIGTSKSLKSWWAGEENEYHWALKDVSFELFPGEALGMIGPNGAGKSTMLKILSHVTTPSSGQLHLNGRFSALIELGAGFHPELSGRDNIYLNGTILGMRRREIDAKFDEIVEFAGIGKFLDTPVKRYSSGMQARLGFAIAAHIEPEIMLVDEVLAVGDFAFQTKCYARMDELRRLGTALIFVSHNMDVVRRVCDRGLVMYGGQAHFQGSAGEAVVAYSDVIREAAHHVSGNPAPREGGLSQRIMTFDAQIMRVRLYNANRTRASPLYSGDRAVLMIDVHFHRPVLDPIFSFFIRTSDGLLLYNITTQWMKIKTGSFAAGQHSRVEFPFQVNLLEGVYELGVDVATSDLSFYYDRVECALSFVVKSSGGAQGLADLAAQVILK